MPIWLRTMRAPGYWQIRLWLPCYTIRLSCERKNDMPGSIKGGWEKAGDEPPPLRP